MIKFNSETGELLISGSVIDLSIESLAFIRSIYRSIGEENEQAAEVYKDFFDKMIKNAFLSSEELNEQAEEAKKQTFKTMDSIKELLDELKGKMEHMDDESEESKGSADTLHDEFERFLHGED